MDILAHVLTVVLLLWVALPAPLICSYRNSFRPTRRPDPDPRPEETSKQVCQEVSSRVQRQVLGSMFNPHYMLIGTPDDANSGYGNPDSEKLSDIDESGNEAFPFYLKEDTDIDLSDEPPEGFYSSADDLEPPDQGNSSAVNKPKPRKKRNQRHVFDPVIRAMKASGNYNFKWLCKAPETRIYLGEDYIPKFLRSVDCNNSHCRGSEEFQCRPLSFAITVLRRRAGVCNPGFKVHKDTVKFSEKLMPDDLRENYVQETRAVRFCCVCELIL